MPKTTLTAADGHQLGAYRAKPADAASTRGGVVVLQEIFGVNEHIRAVVDGFAADGYDAIAPALFDRAEPDVELGYDDEGFARGRALVGQLDGAETMLDIDAGRAVVSDAGRVAAVGYCYGGALAWVAASAVEGLACCVSYYGSRIPSFIDHAPNVPTMLHVGKLDASFPLEKVDEIAARHPDVIVHRYDAGHGFNCDLRADYDAEASRVARERTIEMFRAYVG